MNFLFALTVFLAAGLLFVVQPMFARMMLPLLGGAPSVWNTAMMFYQGALVAGYGLAHVVTARLEVRLQTVVLLLVLWAAVLVLPLGVRAGCMPPSEGNPIPWMLLMMAATVGWPFLALSTLSPTLQRWFAACGERNPYWLYAASNAGSLSGLVVYPLVIEPWFGLRLQSWMWSAGYVVVVVMVTGCAVVFWRRNDATGYAPHSDAPVGESVIGAWQRLQWVLLAAAPSSLMLSVTSHLSMEVAAMPLLWVVPLGIYLVTFVLAFARRQWPGLSWMSAALPWVVLPLTVMYGMRLSRPLWLVCCWNLLALFVGAMVCHGRLAAERPRVERLTEFYLWVSLGGACGGVFNGLVAPLVFDGVVEYPVSISLVCVLSAPWSPLRWSDFFWPAAIGGCGWLLGEWVRLWPPETARAAVFLKLTAPAVAALLLRRRPAAFGFAVAALFAVATWLPGERERVLRVERSFFGVHRVRRDVQGEFHYLEHGTTLHGVQNMIQANRDEPLGYYSRGGPVGQLFAARRQMRLPMRRVGLVGLGIGSMAAYAEPGERWTFFEIDPVVARIARDSELFTHLANCRGEVDVVLGDARLSLQRCDERFDVLVLDAYSSDSIPLHLMTREALRLYLQRLAPDGWLIFHFSNRHFRLQPVLAALAEDAGLACRVQEQARVSAQEKSRGIRASSWAVMCRAESDLGVLLGDARWQVADRGLKLRVWTDDYASVLPLLR
ncbi:MAG: fused MFS/spermidine synthase [Verrucomicrobiae bacterium]|nr:fused MFS/spermidine synthase [Verrucomicrobiae bacterium]